MKVDVSHLKYFNVMINDSTKHRLFIVPGQGISFILGIVSVAGCIYCKLRNCKARKGNNKGKCNGPLF